jgi:AcrR family transcriptional regulator
VATRKRARSPADKEKQLKKIMDECERLFEQHGAGGVSIRALSRHLNMAPSNMYNYFASERELWQTLIAKHSREQEEKLQRIIDAHEGDNVKLLKVMIRFYMQADVAHYSQYHVMLEASTQSSGGEEAPFSDPSMMRMREIIVKAIEAEEIERVDPDLLLFYIQVIIHGYVSITRSKKMRELSPDPDAFVEFAFKTAFTRKK